MLTIWTSLFGATESAAAIMRNDMSVDTMALLIYAVPKFDQIGNLKLFCLVGI